MDDKSIEVAEICIMLRLASHEHSFDIVFPAYICQI